MRGRAPSPLAALATSLLLAVAVAAQEPPFDLVVAGGRVIDPESGLDGVLHLGIRDGTIAAVSVAPLEGRATIDATGLVVAPGFIDLHAHGQDAENYRYHALDGVTTALELEVGTGDVEAWYREREPGQLVNYGVSIGHIPVRMAVMGDSGAFLPSGPAAHREAGEAEIREMIRRIERGLDGGAVAVGMGLAYTPAASAREALEVFRAAGRRNATVHIHLRGGIAGLLEAIAAATVAGAPLHVVHVNSSGGSETREFLRVIAAARHRGLDVTTEAYPYTAGMTRIESALFDDWESWPDDRFARYEWPKTGERLTRDAFARYRESGGFVVIHSNTEEMVAAAVESPLAMIASDGLLVGAKGHPRTTGTYAKVLGRYVRERGSFGLAQALARMTIMPARRLEDRVPAMRVKGRIREGADADLVLFDPARVVDRSTYAEPTLPPLGIVHVVVNGVPVVRDGALVEGARPGRPIRAPIRG